MHCKNTTCFPLEWNIVNMNFYIIILTWQIVILNESFEGYELPPRTQFSMLKKPAVSIKYGQLTFNMAAIRLFEGVKHVLTVVNTEKKRLAVVHCAEEESASVEWARVNKQGKWDFINIGVGVIAALGDPSHICLLRNMKEKSLAVVACDGKDNMPIRVPEGFLELHKSFKIHSKQFVYKTLTGWGLNPEKTYSFKGEYLEEQKSGCFWLEE